MASTRKQQQVKRKIENFNDEPIPAKLAKRQRNNDMPAVVVDLTAPIHQLYHHILQADAVAFLYSQRLSSALQEPAQRCAMEYDITPERAIEEFRRFIAIKAFINDKNADKISPSPLSMFLTPKCTCLSISSAHTKSSNSG